MHSQAIRLTAMDSKESNKVSVDSKITVGRLINTSIAVNFVCVMIAALVVVGTMAHLHSDVSTVQSRAIMLCCTAAVIYEKCTIAPLSS